MPSKYPVCKSRDVIRVLERAGFSFVSQRGSHKKFTDGTHIVIIPEHREELKTGTLKGILEQAGMTVDQFIRLM